MRHLICDVIIFCARSWNRPLWPSENGKIFVEIARRDKCCH